MQKIASLLLITGIIFPMHAFSQNAEIVTRRDGFLFLWEGIHRPAQPAKTRFSDVPETALGSLEIDYAASRGIIDDEEERFRPDEGLDMEDALVWLFRTRNIADPDLITRETLPEYLQKYPVAQLADERQSVSRDDLLHIAGTLDEMLVTEDHEVSLYAEKFHGKGTAFGESFDMNAFTAAHKTLPYNTLVKVTNVENGKSVVVRINDRGPFVDGRDMDLSLASFTAIAERSKGVIRARFERLGDASLVGACGGTASMQRRIGGGVALSDGVPSFIAFGNSLKLSAKRAFVVRGILYPDGNELAVQDYVHPGETFEFRPAVEGAYSVIVGSVKGRKRVLKMEVMKCADSQ